MELIQFKHKKYNEINTMNTHKHKIHTTHNDGGVLVLPIFNNVIVAGDAVAFVVNIYGDALFLVVVVCEINSNGKHCAAPSIYN